MSIGEVIGIFINDSNSGLGGGEGVDGCGVQEEEEEEWLSAATATVDLGQTLTLGHTPARRGITDQPRRLTWLYTLLRAYNDSTRGDVVGREEWQ